MDEVAEHVLTDIVRSPYRVTSYIEGINYIMIIIISIIIIIIIITIMMRVYTLVMI